MTLLALLLALTGFACLALGMDRHHRDAFGALPGPRQKRRFKALGSLGVAGAVACSLAAWGIAYGVVAAFGVLAVGAAVPLLWLSFRAAPNARPSPRAPRSPDS